MIVGFDKREQGVLIRRRVIGVDIALHRSRRRLTAFREFLEELVAEDFGGRGGLHDLEEEFGGCFGFFDTGGEFVGRGEAVAAVVAGEVVLLAGVEGRSV